MPTITAPWRSSIAVGGCIVALLLPAVLRGGGTTQIRGPHRGGTVVIAATDPGHFNPGLTTGAGTHLVAGNIYNGLVQFNEQLEPVPSLAQSWTVSADGRVYTFHLSTGVTWHDGIPFTSADVKFSFERVLLRFHSRTKAGLEHVLARIDTPDDATVVFRFKVPYAPLLQRLDVVEAPILPRHRFAGTDIATAAANREPVGTGPFRFKEYVEGDHVTLVRNERYFKPGLPLLDQVVFKIVAPAGQAVALERGTVDYISSLGGRDIARLRDRPEIVVRNAPAGPGGSFCLDTLIFNLRRPRFKALNVRRAFAHGIDRQQILNEVRLGLGRVATGPIAPSLSWAYSPRVRIYEFDRIRAGELLDAAGLTAGTDGGRFGADFVFATGFARTAAVVQANMARVGVHLRLHPLDVNVANERIFVGNDFDVALASYCNGSDLDIGVTRAYVSTNVRPIPFSNGAGYRNPRIDRLFSAAASTIDTPERTRLYRDIQAILVEEAPYWWLVETDLLRAHRSVVHDLRLWAGDLLERAWLASEQP